MDSRSAHRPGRVASGSASLRWLLVAALLAVLATAVGAELEGSSGAELDPAGAARRLMTYVNRKKYHPLVSEGRPIATNASQETEV